MESDQSSPEGGHSRIPVSLGNQKAAESGDHMNRDAQRWSCHRWGFLVKKGME